MSKYSKEYSKMKGSAKSKLQEFIAGIKDGSIRISGNEPKMSIRALRTLLLSGDEVHGDLVESFLSGNLTTEQFKNKLRGASETRIPKPLRRIPTDRIHHLTPLELANIVENMPDNELFTLLQDYEKEGYFFGDTDENVRGGSFDERAHTGARPKASKSKIVYPNELGEPGLREMSAHPRGTRDTIFDVEAKPTTAAEAREIITPLLKQGEADIQRGIIADTPRRAYINQQLVEKGVIEQGVDIFSANIDDATLKKAAPYLSSAEMQKGAALAFKTPTLDFKGGGATLNRAALTGLAVAGVAALGPLGTAASAAELAGRTQIAGETNDPADQFQAGLAGASLVADVASYVPPLAPIGEAVSTAADAANIGIDVYREDPEKAKQMVTQQAKRMIPADPIVTPVQRAAQAVQRGGRVKFGFGGAKFTLPEFGLSELLRFN